MKKLFPYVAMPIMTICVMIILNLYGMNVPDLAESEIRRLVDEYGDSKKLNQTLSLVTIKSSAALEKFFPEKKQASADPDTKKVYKSALVFEPEPTPVAPLKTIPTPEAEITPKPITETADVSELATSHTEADLPDPGSSSSDTTEIATAEPEVQETIVEALEPIKPLIIPASISRLLSREAIEIPSQVEVQFAFNSTRLSTADHDKLNSIVTELENEPLLGIQIRGYADALGDHLYNEKLSRTRSIRVREALVAKGIAPERIEVFPFGSSLSPQGESANHRRVDLVYFEL